MDQSLARNLIPRRTAVPDLAPNLPSTRLPSVARSRSVARLRIGLVTGCCLAAALAFWQGDPSGYLMADPALARLLRGMALIKAAIALGASSAVYWRLAWPASRTVASLYVIASWVLAGSSVLIWQLSFIAFAALLFHAAALSMLVLAWRER